MFTNLSLRSQQNGDESGDLMEISQAKGNLEKREEDEPTKFDKFRGINCCILQFGAKK